MTQMYTIIWLEIGPEGLIYMVFSWYISRLLFKIDTLSIFYYFILYNYNKMKMWFDVVLWHLNWMMCTPYISREVIVMVDYEWIVCEFHLILIHFVSIYLHYFWILTRVRWWKSSQKSLLVEMWCHGFYRWYHVMSSSLPAIFFFHEAFVSDIVMLRSLLVIFSDYEVFTSNYCKKITRPSCISMCGIILFLWLTMSQLWAAVCNVELWFVKAICIVNY